MLGLQRSGDISVPMSTAITREVTLTGACRFADEMDAVLAAIGDGSLRVDAIVTHVLPIERARDAFEIAADPASSSRVLTSFADSVAA